MSNRPPLVSVIIPAHNAEATLGRAINSVLAQTHQPLEILVIDDASTDATATIAESYESSVIHLLRQADQAGVYAARNRGLTAAHGEFIAFLDADDWWLPTRLASQLPLFSRPEVGLVFGNMEMVDERTSPPCSLGTIFEILKPARGKILINLARCNFIGTSTVLTRKICFDRIGPFSNQVKRGADYLKWMEILLYWEADYVEEPLIAYALSVGSLSNSKLQQINDALQVFETEYSHLDQPEHRHAYRTVIIQAQWRLVLIHLWYAIKILFAIILPKGALADASLGERLRETGLFWISYPYIPLRIRWLSWRKKRNGPR